MRQESLEAMKRSDGQDLFPNLDATTISLLPVLDDFHEGVMITDAKGVILYMNTAQANIDDFTAAEVVGQKVTDLYRVDEGTSPAMTCIKSGKAIRNLACYYRTHLGKVVNSIHNIYPLSAAEHLIGTICYITNYKTVEQTMAAIGKTPARRPLPTYGVPPDAAGPGPRINGTRYTFEDIVGADIDLLAAVKAAQLAAVSPSPIMLFGETGTGKELFAQSIHNRSDRNAKPYIAINCTAIPENLLEGMLFGTAKGAFTGAIDKAGLLENADGGTLFLDEINCMSPSLQAKLLRFLQERKVRRVGATQEVDVDIKVISSTNVAPHLAIDEGGLRADLFYRLAVVYIHIPPLRERKNDLSRLIAHFLQRTNARLGKQVTAVSTAVMNQFDAYTWPGNVRELAHVIEGAMNMVGGDQTIHGRHLKMALSMKTRDQNPPAPEPAPPNGHLRMGFPVRGQKSTQADKPLATLKREHEIAAIRSALAATRGNAARAARDLGISPQLLNYKLKRFCIDRRAFKDR